MMDTKPEKHLMSTQSDLVDTCKQCIPAQDGLYFLILISTIAYAKGKTRLKLS